MFYPTHSHHSTIVVFFILFCSVLTHLQWAWHRLRGGTCLCGEPGLSSPKKVENRRTRDPRNRRETKPHKARRRRRWRWRQLQQQLKTPTARNEKYLWKLNSSSNATELALGGGERESSCLFLVGSTIIRGIWVGFPAFWGTT